MISTWIFSKCSRKMRLTGWITWWKLKSTTDCKFHYGPEAFTAPPLAKLAIYPADGEIALCSLCLRTSLVTLTWGEGLPEHACHRAWQSNSGQLMQQSAHMCIWMWASASSLHVFPNFGYYVLLLLGSFEPEELLYSYFLFRDDIMHLCWLSLLFCAVRFWKFTCFSLFFFFFSIFPLSCHLPVPSATSLLKKGNR